MFTGLVQGIGTVLRLSRRGEDALLEIETDMNLEDVRIGDSIAVNGACLTATSYSRRSFTADSVSSICRGPPGFISGASLRCSVCLRQSF